VGKIKKQRQKLRRRLAKMYYRPGFGVPCVWCGEIVDHREAHIHEFLVRRAQVPKKKQHLIFVEENCGLLHAECHVMHDTAPGLRVKFLWYIRKNVRARQVFSWYKMLIAEGVMLRPFPPLLATRRYAADYACWVSSDKKGWLLQSTLMDEAFCLQQLLCVYDIDSEEFLDANPNV